MTARMPAGDPRDRVGVRGAGRRDQAEPAFAGVTNTFDFGEAELS
jgi:hypothetical protein